MHAMRDDTLTFGYVEKSVSAHKAIMFSTGVRMTYSIVSIGYLLDCLSPARSVQSAC